jgi:hypothetical protein
MKTAFETRSRHGARVLARIALLLLGCNAAACSQPRSGAAAQAECSVQAIVALREDPNPSLVADLGRVSGARLALVRTMTTNLHLFALTAPGGEADCIAAVERLRSDARVRSVDLDQRRQIQ